MIKKTQKTKNRNKNKNNSKTKQNKNKTKQKQKTTKKKNMVAGDLAFDYFSSSSSLFFIFISQIPKINLPPWR